MPCYLRNAAEECVERLTPETESKWHLTRLVHLCGALSTGDGAVRTSQPTPVTHRQLRMSRTGGQCCSPRPESRARMR